MTVSSPNRRSSVVLIALVAVLASGCASTQGGRHRAVIGVTGIHAALAAVQDTTDALHQQGLMTDAQHQALNRELVPVLTVGRDLTKAVRAWPPGQPTPPEMADLAGRLGDLLTTTVGLLPEGAAKSTLLARIAAVQQALIVILTLLSSGGQ
jgi:hypothetical protein